jgi:hypothetical protein
VNAIPLVEFRFANQGDVTFKLLVGGRALEARRQTVPPPFAEDFHAIFHPFPGKHPTQPFIQPDGKLKFSWSSHLG